MEANCNVTGNLRFLYPRLRPSRPCPNVPKSYGIIRYGSGSSRRIYGSLYFSPRIQQFLLVITSYPFHLRPLTINHRIPMQSAFGRRPVLIFSTLVCLVINVWRAVATTYGSYMGACVLNGFGAGPAEASFPTYPHVVF